LLEQLKLAKHQQFCPSSEQTPAGQLSLFDEAETLADPAAPEPEIETIKSYRRRKAGQVGLDRLPDDLPVSHTYACRHCETHSDHVPVVKAPMPNPVIKGSFASPEAIAHIAYEKFVMGSPLYRQEQDWARKGVPLSRQTMANWLIRATNDWLMPIYDRLKELLLEHQVLHGDETTLQVLHEEGKTATQKSYMWVYRTGCDAKRHIVIFEYQPDRKAIRPAEFLDAFEGYLHADGYSGYHNLKKEITVVGCWAHTRRKFFDIIKTMCKEKRAGTQAMRGVQFCDLLFKLEEDFAKLPEHKTASRWFP